MGHLEFYLCLFDPKRYHKNLKLSENKQQADEVRKNIFSCEKMAISLYGLPHRFVSLVYCTCCRHGEKEVMWPFFYANLSLVLNEPSLRVWRRSFIHRYFLEPYWVYIVTIQLFVYCVKKTALDTVPTLNSCTKCKGRITQPHTRLPPMLLHMVAWVTAQLNAVLIHKLRGSLISLALFFDMIAREFVQPGTGRRLVDWRRI